MATSKIFLGGLPELINKIIQNFQNDFSTLHSCILVNRLWCRISIPLLWEDPFSIPTKNFNFIEIYLYNLSENDKKKLNEYGIIEEKDSNLNTVFNYPRYIKNLNTHKIICSVEKWNVNSSNSCSTFSQISNSTRLISKLLFKTFIESEVNLNSFEFEMTTDNDHDYFNDTVELILQNPNFINNIKNLKFSKRVANITNITKIDSFLLLLSTNCNSISTLHFKFKKRSDDIFIENFLSRIINLQQNLKKILFSYKISPLHHLLSNSNCSNTLRTIIFHNVNFRNISVFKEVFEHLNVLDSVHIHYCYSLTVDFIQQIVDITKPFKLRTLFLSKLFEIRSFQLLLQKSGDYLENVGFGSLTSYDLKQQLFELISEYCTKIKFLKLPGFYNSQNINLAFDLIKSIGINLNYLSIHFYKFGVLDQNDEGIIKLNSLLLQELGQILPTKLEYLNLSLMIDSNDFEIFLKNSQNIFIKKLLIRNKMQIISENDILFYLEKYIMKKSRVNYLAFKEDYMKKGDLFYSKDLVKKFESYNIKIQSYDDLNINSYEYIKEMY
ncbi:hypothetical protein RhiirA1_460676 [Rhizophagus irregularis]|uniref:F-box domain-containing protein n=3 Tax=Rhizophagus irregularis TaxID=588596 RepID=A0A2N0RQZ4_9GLOM|nr:hypothetical protein GLOIN_2v1867006 [Rhizophagus irregularis DAOM 181602=DAOM 197198]PKC65728.1 hypothetical protein RhiirA1_460676 [Rhizophagus irregularis]POG83051.1 hypothetical protein GLOIN_2v1867006 [Rhizophagus irregularis DAOM 181602=DAOM 197198]UZO10594.1 hypothetical protein OCT59_002174 [Rhizophagus irregularis]GBC47193.1 hypothetical protein GLOIN_2v1867006 [Rhizophagus irregularis DAOM 181602=DAOM 197198]|eukprot:XP_025189917.1 hypothetical protein GLOIN_2v1867006 [Rhizophagus irregularis DAOM 181602=DAOM 197198]